MVSKPFFVTIFVCLTLSLAAQVTFYEDFDSTDFAHSWYGDTSNFVIRSGELQTTAIEDVPSVNLFKPFIQTDSSYWEAQVRLGFNPSKNNFLRINLNMNASEQEGIWLQVGGQDGGIDLVSLYIRQNGKDSLLFLSDSAFLAKNPMLSFNVAIQQDSLIAILSGNETVRFEAKVPRFEGLAYFGIEPHFTPSRSDKFFIDAVRIGNILVDTIKPTIRLIRAEAEALCFEASEILSSYTVDSNSAFINERSFCVPLIADTLNFELVLEDLEQNKAIFQFDTIIRRPQIPFEENSLIISELMIDPTPSFGLPNAEYIEIFNPTNMVFDLKEVEVIVNDKTVLLEGSINPKSYLLLVKEGNEQLFNHSNILGLKLPALVNTGAIIQMESMGLPIYSLSYGANAMEGIGSAPAGKSLSIVSTNIDCSGKRYIVSSEVEGGSPGQANQIFTDYQIEVINQSSGTIILLNESVSSVLVYQGIDSSSCLKVNGTQFSCLVEQDIIDSVVLYTCDGARIRIDTTIWLGASVKPRTGDLYFSEIHPAPIDKSEFIELYNPSNTVFDLSDLQIVRKGESCGAAFLSGLIFEKSALVLSTNISDWLGHPKADKDLFQTYKLPRLRNEGDIIMLKNCVDQSVVDSLAYSLDNAAFVSDERGASIERPSLGGEVYLNGVSPWNASPTYLPPLTSTNSITLQSTLLAPNDADLSLHVLEIEVQCDQECVVTGELFKETGEKLGEVFETFSFVKGRKLIEWSGNIGNQSVESGIYLIFLQVLTVSGDRERIKKSITIQR